MGRQIRFNAFDMNCVGHQSPGLWAPSARSILANTRISTTGGSGQDAGARHFRRHLHRRRDRLLRRLQGQQLPRASSRRRRCRSTIRCSSSRRSPWRPSTSASAITASTSFEHPYTFARRLSTADHLTKGRVGWNIVTSYLESGANNIGQGGLRRHDNRYDVADEYLEVLYKLLEGSWEEGAVVRDREQRHLHRSRQGPRDRPQGQILQGARLSSLRAVAAAHAGALPGRRVGPGKTSPPSTPNASSSPRRPRRCSRPTSPTCAARRPRPAAIRARSLIYNLDHRDRRRDRCQGAGEVRRNTSNMRPTTARWCSCPAGPASTSASTPRPISSGRSRPMRSCPWSSISPAVRQGVDHRGAGAAGAASAGSGRCSSARRSTIADILQEWVEETDVDGFNLAYAVTPETFEDIVELLVPELQKRGVYPKAYRQGTLREKLFGEGHICRQATRRRLSRHRGGEARARRCSARRPTPETVEA